MKKKFSVRWKSSKQPRKQRKYRYNAPMHVRQKFVAAHLSRELRKEFGKRSLGVRKGDEVVVLTGKHKDKKGKVSKVDLKKIKIFIENVKASKVSGQEVETPLDPSNVVITKLNLDDSKRKEILEKSRKSIQQEAKK